MSSKIIDSLVSSAKKGSAEAFGELYEIYSKDMFRFAYYYLGSSVLAEDCVSECVCIAFQKIGSLRKPSAFKSWLFKILHNCCIIDLMVPFQKKHYYCKEMQGSYSIKYVLPALFPNVPELDYHNLEGVHNGAEASATFLRMATMDKEELETYRNHLLEYCKLDTLAMVKIWEKLHEVIE